MGKNLDSFFAETQDIEVKSFRNMFRYRKKFKQEDETKGRKNARFHQKDKDRGVGTRRD